MQRGDAVSNGNAVFFISRVQKGKDQNMYYLAGPYGAVTGPYTMAALEANGYRLALDTNKIKMRVMNRFSARAGKKGSVRSAGRGK